MKKLFILIFVSFFCFYCSSSVTKNISENKNPKNVNKANVSFSVSTTTGICSNCN